MTTLADLIRERALIVGFSKGQRLRVGSNDVPVMIKYRDMLSPHMFLELTNGKYATRGASDLCVGFLKRGTVVTLIEHDIASYGLHHPSFAEFFVLVETPSGRKFVIPRRSLAGMIKVP